MSDWTWHCVSIHGVQYTTCIYFTSLLPYNLERWRVILATRHPPTQATYVLYMLNSWTEIWRSWLKCSWTESGGCRWNTPPWIGNHGWITIIHLDEWELGSGNLCPSIQLQYTAWPPLMCICSIWNRLIFTFARKSEPAVPFVTNYIVDSCVKDSWIWVVSGIHHFPSSCIFVYHVFPGAKLFVAIC